MSNLANFGMVSYRRVVNVFTKQTWSWFLGYCLSVNIKIYKTKSFEVSPVSVDRNSSYVKLYFCYTREILRLGRKIKVQVRWTAEQYERSPDVNKAIHHPLPPAGKSFNILFTNAIVRLQISLPFTWDWIFFRILLILGMETGRKFGFYFIIIIHQCGSLILS